MMISQSTAVADIESGRTEPPAGYQEPPTRANRLRSIAAVVAAVAALTALLYILSAHSYPADSDSATVVLEGQAIAAGHLTLHGWALSVDSFWSVDAVFYAIGILVVGLRSVLLHLIPAFVAALVVMMGIVIAREGRRGAASVAAAVIVVTLLGLPSPYLTYFFVRGPVHIGTTLWCLVAFFMLRRGRTGVEWLVAVAFLAAGLLGDLQTVGIGVAPVLCAGLAAMVRTRRWRAGAPVVGAAAASLVLAGTVREAGDLIGTFAIGKVQPSATTSEMLVNLRNLLPDGLHMLGIQSSTEGVPPLLEDVRIVGVLLVVSALVYFATRLVIGVVKGGTPAEPGGSIAPVEGSTEFWRLDDLLFFGFLGGVVIFVKLSTANIYAFDRYLTSAVICACILAARMVAAWITEHHSARTLWSAAVIALVCVGAFASADFTTNADLTKSDPNQSVPNLGRFLEAHELRVGLGDYWSSSIVTVDTDGAVTVRPVTSNPAGTIVRYERQSSASWYAGTSFQFLVFNTARPENVDSSRAEATFGPVLHTYRVGTYRVLVWSHPVSVSTMGFDPG
jgi:hypothetical protein